MDIGTWQIVIVVGIIAFIIFRNIKNRPKQIPNKKTQKFLKDLEHEAKMEAKYNRKTKLKNNETSGDLGSSLKKLKKMYKDGHLSKVEFEQAKNKLLK